MTALDRLWAGWRHSYITAPPEGGGPGGDSGGESSDTCVFCRILASGEPDTTTHVVWRHPGGLVVALLNAFPYASGHVLVMPGRHLRDLDDLSRDESPALWAAVESAVAAVSRAYQPEGINVGCNLGPAAGAGVPGHLHLHVLPRWVGDTNFMTSVADARVLPEALSVTDERLRAAWGG